VYQYLFRSSPTLRGGKPRSAVLSLSDQRYKQPSRHSAIRGRVLIARAWLAFDSATRGSDFASLAMRRRKPITSRSSISATWMCPVCLIPCRARRSIRILMVFVVVGSTVNSSIAVQLPVAMGLSCRCSGLERPERRARSACQQPSGGPRTFLLPLLQWTTLGRGPTWQDRCQRR